jgi:hypothetical protein
MQHHYTVQVQWGDLQSEWNVDGQWNMGCRPQQNVVKVSVDSHDGGETLQGSMVYTGEGPIGLRATRIGGNQWHVENQWGGDAAPWHEGGNWTLGSRPNQPLVRLHIESHDKGNSFSGSMTYQEEGPIGVQVKKNS